MRTRAFLGVLLIVLIVVQVLNGLSCVLIQLDMTDFRFDFYDHCLHMTHWAGILSLYLIAYDRIQLCRSLQAGRMDQTFHLINLALLGCAKLSRSHLSPQLSCLPYFPLSVRVLHHLLKDIEADVIYDKTRETFVFRLEVVTRRGRFGFVFKVEKQHGRFAFVFEEVEKQQSFVEDTRSTAPSSSTPQQRPDLVSIIQSWRKLEMLGSGSFGTVYEGVSEDGIYFAVKEVSLSENDSKAQECVSQLEREIRFLSKFQHENIVRYLGTQREPDKLYIFLELVTKGSLSSLYAKHKLSNSQIRSYTRQILSGLEYLHEQKVVHRDIKCANILVDVYGEIKVADFGLAKQISQLDELNSFKGSAYWMAPEVIDPRKTYSFPADIWSLGCTVLEMEARHPPNGDVEWFQALWKVGRGEAPPIPDHLSEDSKDFIRRCLEVNPAKRPSARKLLEHPFVRYAGTRHRGHDGAAEKLRHGGSQDPNVPRDPRILIPAAESDV